MKVWTSEGIVNPQNAKVSVLDHGLLYGDGVFEGIRATRGRVVDLELHLERLHRSARSIWLSVPPFLDLREIVLSTFAANAKPNAYARLVVTRGPGKLGLDPEGCTPTTFCIVDSIQLFSKESQASGLKLATVSQRRPEPDVLDPSVKSLNYLNNILAKLDAKRQGADEALVLNRRGTVAEASGANVFALKGKRLLTPPSSDGALPGLTRQRVLRLAPEVGLEPEQATLTRYDLLAADEVVLTGTGAGLQRVQSLDGVTIPRPPIPLSARLEPALNQDIDKHGVPFGVPHAV